MTQRLIVVGTLGECIEVTVPPPPPLNLQVLLPSIPSHDAINKMAKAAMDSLLVPVAQPRSTPRHNNRAERRREATRARRAK